MIAMISQSYEKFMNLNTIYMNQNKVELYKEYLMIMIKMPWVKIQINLLIMFSPASMEESIIHEWLRFVQTLKTFIVIKNTRIKSHICSNFADHRPHTIGQKYKDNNI